VEAFLVQVDGNQSEDALGDAGVVNPLVSAVAALARAPVSRKAARRGRMNRARTGFGMWVSSEKQRVAYPPS
jgi:hypothetical protein